MENVSAGEVASTPEGERALTPAGERVWPPEGERAWTPGGERGDGDGPARWTCTGDEVAEFEFESSECGWDAEKERYWDVA